MSSSKDSYIPQPPIHANELLITRVFHAPRKLLWQVWNEPGHMELWWGPKGFTARVPEQDLRTDGQWQVIMVGPDGKEYPCQGKYIEVTPYEKIVSTDEFAEEYKATSEIDLPTGLITTTIFEDVGTSQDKTRVTIRIMHPNQEEKKKHEAMGVVPGWNSMLDCLEEHLATLAG